MERFVIIDGNAILHRAFHALPPLTTSSGELVNAVFGFTSMLLKVRDELKPSYFAVAFDLPKPTFRNKMFVSYQAKRPEMAKELSGQIDKVKEIVRVLGIPIYEKEGYEADDIIGTLSLQAKVPKIKNQKSKIKMTNKNSKMSEGIGTIIVTGDRDMLQLVDESTKVYMPVKGLSEVVLYDKEKVREKFGLEPEQIPDYKGLVGDPSDNYPGVSGIGPKTAVSLLQRYGSFLNLYQCIETLKQKQPRVAERLEAGREGGELSCKLATIVRDAPVELDLEKCKIENFDRPEVRELFKRLEFRSLLRRLNSQQTASDRQQENRKNERRRKRDGANQMSLF